MASVDTPAKPSKFGLPLLRRFTSSAVGGSLEGEAYLRLHHYAVFVALGVPTMLVFGVINVVQGTTAIGVSIIASCLGLTLGLYALLRLGWGPSVYRLNFLYFALISGFGAHYGGPGGSYALWAYSYPLLAFFLFGLREGMVWAAVMLCGVVTAMLAPGGFAFEPGFVLRFVASYAMVTAVTYGYEHLRTAYRRGMEQEQQALRQALDEVKTLRGLIPICAGCNQIRDDAGFWQRLESYFEDRSDARFSHGLCPDCARRLYPDLVEDLQGKDGAAASPPLET